MKYKSQKVAYWFFALCYAAVFTTDCIRLYHGLCTE